MNKIVLLGTLCIVTALQAQIKPIVKLGYDAGGDDIAYAEFENGDKEALAAGDGLFIEGGVAIETPMIAPYLETQLTLGYKIDSIEASNATLDFSRAYINFMEVYRFQNLNIGGGLTYHFSPKLDGTRFANNLNYTFDDALGGVVQIGYSFAPELTFGIRGTIIKYDEPNYTATDANSIGFFMSYTFN